MTAKNAPSLYVHVPFCRQKCPYCAFYSEPLTGYDPADYARAARAHIDSYQHLGPFHTAYLGGGSPAVLGQNALLRLTEKIAEHLQSGAEFTIEINPDQAEPALVKDLHKAGVNRVSIGAQSFDNNQLQRLGRTYRADAIARACQTVRQAGLENISLDLIYAAPDMSISSWRHTLAISISLNPAHISTYSLAYEPGTAMYALLQAGQIAPADEDTDRQMYEIAIETLAQAQLQQYELSNFTKKGYACAHNKAYWLNKPYIGIGPAAHSSYNRQRWSNPADIGTYLADYNARTDRREIDDEEFACETAVLNLRLTDGIDIDRFIAHTSRNPLKIFAQPLEKYRQMGMIRIENGKIALTRPAMAVADTICCDFSSL